VGSNAAELLACTLADKQEFVRVCRQRAEQWEQTVKDLRQQVQQEQQRQALRCLLPDEATVNKLMRYEAHLRFIRQTRAVGLAHSGSA